MSTLSHLVDTDRRTIFMLNSAVSLLKYTKGKGSGRYFVSIFYTHKERFVEKWEREEISDLRTIFLLFYLYLWRFSWKLSSCSFPFIVYIRSNHPSPNFYSCSAESSWWWKICLFHGKIHFSKYI